ncbi:MAG: DUF1217 domain-containing protein [Pararhodobacter sp.]|nr:DUF1217 domain-containing protein [Pararhodobacter sp.]
MSFQPVLPTGGYVGWRFLERTLERQQEQHASMPMAQRDEARFREKIGSIDNARALTNDRQLLRVALTAFGLAEDLPNRAFIQRVLESPTSERGSFANRMADRRYQALAAAFGFGETEGPRTREPGFADRVLALYRERSFEAAVGQQDDSMRMALALQRDLTEIAQRDASDEAHWLRVLGTPSLRKVFETAFNLPSAFGAQDLDRQVEIMKRRSRSAFGDSTVSQFTDSDKRDALIRRFFIGEQVAQVSTLGSGATALALLQAGQGPARGPMMPPPLPLTLPR